MQGLCTYLPSTILDYLYLNSDELEDKEPPFRQDYETVVLFADVSGFTKLSETFADRGARGHELLKKHLNSYFEVLMRESTSQGGDVFKFAGDAILVVWPRSNEALSRVTRRAVQCAIQIKEQLTGYKILDPDRPVERKDEMVLNVKLGIGVGKISILHIGGFFGRMEYVATGQPLTQSFNAEGKSKKGDYTTLVVASPEVWSKVNQYFESYKVEAGYAFVKCPKRGMTLPKVSVFKTTTSLKHIRSEQEGSKIMKRVLQYVPGAVRPYVKDFEESWADELRVITVLFVNLGLVKGAAELYNNDDDLKRIHHIMQTVQKAVYKYEGSLNKFLMDDKGSTLIAVFGLPPLAHENDPVRGLLSSIQICTQLHQLGLVPSIGVTTGTAFCGVIGTRNRREYSILGDTVNLAARLMSYSEKVRGGGVLCDEATHYASKKLLKFTKLPEIMVKGKSKPIKIYHPYPKSYIDQFTKDRMNFEDTTPRTKARRRSVVSILDGGMNENTGSGGASSGLSGPSTAPSTPRRRGSRTHRRSWLFWRSARGIQPHPKMTEKQSPVPVPRSGSRGPQSQSGADSLPASPANSSKRNRSILNKRGSAYFRRIRHVRTDSVASASSFFETVPVPNQNPRRRENTAETAAASAAISVANNKRNVTQSALQLTRKSSRSVSASPSARRAAEHKKSETQDSWQAIVSSDPTLPVGGPPPDLEPIMPPPPPPPILGSGIMRRHGRSTKSAPSSRRNSTSNNQQTPGQHIINSPLLNVRSSLEDDDGDSVFDTPTAVDMLFGDSFERPRTAPHRPNLPHDPPPPPDSKGVLLRRRGRNKSRSGSNPPRPTNTGGMTRRQQSPSTGSFPSPTNKSQLASLPAGTHAHAHAEGSPRRSTNDRKTSISSLGSGKSAQSGEAGGVKSNLTLPGWAKARRAMWARGSSFGGGKDALFLFEEPTQAVSFRDASESMLGTNDKQRLNRLLKEINLDQSRMHAGLENIVNTLDDDSFSTVTSPELNLFGEIKKETAILDVPKPTSPHRRIPNDKSKSQSFDFREITRPLPPLPTGASGACTTRESHEQPRLSVTALKGGTAPPFVKAGIHLDTISCSPGSLSMSKGAPSSSPVLGSTPTPKDSGTSPSHPTFSLSNSPSPRNKLAEGFAEADLTKPHLPRATKSQSTQGDFTKAITSFLENPTADHTGHSMMATSSFSLSASCKVIRVSLPKTFGFQTVDCTKLETIGQITQKLFEIRRRKRLAVPGDSWKQFELCFPRAQDSLKDETRILELPTLRSLHKHEQKKVGHRRNQYSGDMGKSPLDALQMIEADPSDRTYATTDNLMELVLRPRTKVKRDSMDVGIDSMTSQRLHLNRLIEGPQMKKLRRMLLQKINILMSAGKEGKSVAGGQVIIAGGMGLGKTKLLDTTIEESKASGTGFHRRICYAQGAQFDMKKPLAAVRDVFLRLIDQEIHRHYMRYTGTLQENRCGLIVNTLRQKKIFAALPISDLVPVLNQPLHLDFPETRFTLAMSTEERSDTAVRLMIYILELLTKELPAVIMLDDAIFLDAASWKLLLNIARHVPHILLIIATRPLNRSYMAAFAKDIPMEFKTLLRLPSTIYVPLRPRADGVLYKIACVSLGVADLPPKLADFVLARANGNPKVVKEFCYELSHQLKIFKVEDGQVHLRPDIDWNRLSASLRCPFSVRALIARRLDRLTYKAQMLLKIAALIGHRFSFRTISKTYPLKEKKYLETEFQTLQDFRIIMKADPPLLGHVTEADIEWTFVQSFMKSMLRNRLISNQTKQLRVRVLNVRVQHFVDLLSQMKANIKSGCQAIKHSTLGIWNSSNNAWEDRYVVLSFKGMFLLDTVKDWKAVGATKQQIRMWLRVNTALVSKANEFKGKRHTLTLEDVTDYYDRTLTDIFDVPRSFQFAFPSRPMMLEWFELFKTVNQQKNSILFKKKKSLAQRMEVWNNLQQIRSQELKKPHSTQEKSRYEGLFANVIRGLKKKRPDRRADECKVKKFSGRFGMSQYKRRFIMLVSNNKGNRQALDLGGSGRGSEGHQKRRLVSGRRRSSDASNMDSDDDMDAEGVDVLVVSKTDGRKDKVVVTDAVCLSTRLCKVELSGRKAAFDEQEMEKKMAKEKKGEGWCVLITGQLWMKKTTKVWESKTMEVEFDTSEDMYFWYSKVYDAVHVHRRKPDITESALACFYEDDPSTLSPPLSPSQPGFMRATDDDVNSLLRSPISSKDVVPPVSDRENGAILSSPKQPFDYINALAAVGEVEDRKWASGSRGQRVSPGESDHLKSLKSQKTTVILTEPSRMETTAAHRDSTEDDTRITPGRGACAALAPARAVGDMRRDPRGLHQSGHSSTNASKTNSEFLSQAGLTMIPSPRGQSTPRNYGVETASEASMFEETDTPRSSDSLRMMNALDSLEEALERAGDKKIINEKLNELRGMIARADGKTTDILAVMGSHVDRKTSHWIKATYSRRHPTKPHKMIWSNNSDAEDNKDKETSSGSSPASRLKSQLVGKAGDKCSNPFLGDDEDGGAAATMFQLVEALVPLAGRTSSPVSFVWPLRLPFVEIGRIEEWGWNLYGRTDENLFHAVAIMYERCGLFTAFKIEKATFARFVSDIRNRYTETPYHNFRHAVDVTQTVYCLMKKMGLASALTPIERLAMLTAALCHDVQHPGLNNAYHVAAHAPLAVLYNDQSVLENFHAAVTFAVLARPSTNILGNLSRKQYQGVRQAMVHMILSTDMTCHFGMVEAFNNVLDRTKKQEPELAPPSGPKAKAALQARRRVLLNVVLHACDISNPCKPWELCLQWSNRITQEFFAQGDLERKEGLPVTSNMDRGQADQAEISLNFIDFIVGPMFVAIRRLLPEAQVSLECLQENRTNWFRRFDGRVKSRKLEGQTQDKSLDDHKKKWAARNKAFLGMLRRCADSVKDSNPNILSVFPHPRRTQSNTPSSRLLKEKGEKNPESTTKERTQKEASAVASSER